jgi:hypothetical protein
MNVCRPCFLLLKDFFEGWRYLAVDVPHMCTWKVDNVVEQVLEQLKARWLPPQVLVGTDARFTLPILQMAPAWSGDFFRRLQFRPIPAAMRK